MLAAVTPDRAQFRAPAPDAAVLGLFIAAPVAMTWPLALHLDRAISDPGDPFFTTFTIAWDWHALTHGLRLFDAPLFYPDRHALAFSEHMTGVMLVLSPLFALGLAPLTIHNAGVLLAFVANAWCMFLLARWTTRSTLAALVGGRPLRSSASASSTSHTCTSSGRDGCRSRCSFC
jgi:hypothetical protein